MSFNVAVNFNLFDNPPFVFDKKSKHFSFKEICSYSNVGSDECRLVVYLRNDLQATIGSPVDRRGRKKQNTNMWCHQAGRQRFTTSSPSPFYQALRRIEPTPYLSGLWSTSTLHLHLLFLPTSLCFIYQQGGGGKIRFNSNKLLKPK